MERDFIGGLISIGSHPMGLFKGCRLSLTSVAIFSGLINILYLTGSIFMLQIYDRVIPSRSTETLIALSVIALGLFVVHGLFEMVRSRLLGRIGRSVDERLRPQVFALVNKLPLKGQMDIATQPVRDLDTVRGFISGGGPSVFFDLPWVPFYLVVCFVLHPLIGALAFGGALLLVFITLVSELLTRDAVRKASASASARIIASDTVRKNAEIVNALGMNERLYRRWSALCDQHLDNHQKASDLGSTFGSFSKLLRIALQSAALALGAVLVIRGEATGGIIIAGSILVARTLSPIDQMIAQYKSFINARQGWKRLKEQLSRSQNENEEYLALPRPRKALSVESITVAPPGSNKPVLKNVSFTLGSGEVLGVLGLSAAGKSTLARALVGVWQPVNGVVRLDASALDQWTSQSLGRYVGYLPQDVELFDGTIAENISRFAEAPRDDMIIAAAEKAGVHEMIARLPEGYQTRIGSGGSAISGGQRQRIALARALYGDPFLLVLDEPNSNLDSEGEQALYQAIEDFKESGGIVVMIAHRPNSMASVDKVLVLAEGIVKAFGPKDQVLRPLRLPKAGAAAIEKKTLENAS